MKGKGRNEKDARQICSRLSVMSVLNIGRFICAEVMTSYAIIPKNRSASSIAFSLSGGQISIFALSDFALL